jgi:hypothetical protein
MMSPLAAAAAAAANAKKATTPDANAAKSNPAIAKADTTLDDESWAYEPAVSLNDEDDKSTQQRSTARFRRDATSAKVKGTMIAQFPQRLVIKYTASGKRDPFATLIDNKYAYTSPTEQRIPSVEGLKMVGVLQSEAGSKNAALFEDNDGFSYILKSGDKVRNGYVLRVEEDRVFFQIFEYGWSRTLALKMQEI